MKSYSILLFIFLSSFQVFSQDLAGRRIINGSLNFNHLNSFDQSPVTNLQLNILTGKIASDNTYWAFGGNIIVDPSPYNYNISLGPVIERGKFISLIDDLYLAPYLGGRVNGLFGEIEGAELAVYAVPIRLNYLLKEHFMISASFGSVNALINLNNYYQQYSLNASLSNNGSFGIFYTFKK
ncbi:hypothetical protein [Jiulongibacter sp. NS-SX5]|uniref:hypothetical protein n=1 Tax=Jiulongibacter sp. NS-SX5 TaxID=3463854 RepID=UPI0040585A15